MEKILDAEIELAHFRATLEGLVNAHAAAIASTEKNKESPVSPAPNELSTESSHKYCTPEHDEESLARRLARSQELEEKAVLEKRSEALREDAEKYADENKRLKRTCDDLKKQVQNAVEECAKEKSSRMTLSSLIDTLRSNQDEMSIQVKAMSAEKSELESIVSKAEGSASGAIKTMKSQADLIAHLRETTSRHEGRIQVLEEARNAATAEVSRLQKAVDTAAAELDQTQTSVEIAEKLASDRLESLRQSDEIAEAARAEAVAADSRCTATEKALMAVTKELDEFRDEFKNEQEAHIKVKEGLEKLFAEDKSRVQALSMRLDEETAARKDAEIERDSLSEAVSNAVKEKIEAEKTTKRATDDLRILNTKHDRLLAAQRATIAIQSQQHNPGKQQQFLKQQRDQPEEQSISHKRSYNDKKSNDSEHDKRADFNSNSHMHPSSTTAAIKAPRKNDTCPVCSEMAYGLMALCHNCKTPFHSICLPFNQRTLGSKFVCTSCEQPDS